MKEYRIDLQRNDNSQHFSTATIAEDAEEAKSKMEERFPESRVLAIWEKAKFTP